MAILTDGNRADIAQILEHYEREVESALAGEHPVMRIAEATGARLGLLLTAIALKAQYDRFATRPEDGLSAYELGSIEGDPDLS